MSYESAAKNNVILWQTPPDEGVSEPAIMIEFYMDCIQLTQDGQKINLNYESVKDMVKILRTADRPSSPTKMKCV